MTFGEINPTALPVTKLSRICYKDKLRFDYQALDSIDKAAVLNQAVAKVGANCFKHWI